MFFPKIEYSLTTKPLDELTFLSGVLSFYIPEYRDAVELSRKIEQHMS